MKDLEHPNVAAEVHRTKVQIVIISHLFLQRLKLEASTRVRLSPVNRVFRSKRVIAVLVGVNEQEINEGYEAGKKCYFYVSCLHFNHGGRLTLRLWKL